MVLWKLRTKFILVFALREHNIKRIYSERQVDRIEKLGKILYLSFLYTRSKGNNWDA